MALHVLSDSDVSLLKRVIAQHEGARVNTPDRTSTDHSWSLGEDHQAPETYIAKVPTAGIPAKGNNTGTGTEGIGTANTDQAGSADCSLYHIVDVSGSPEIYPISGLTRTVYNLGNAPIHPDSAEYVTVTRTKNGKWLAVYEGADVYWATLDDDLCTDGNTTATTEVGGVVYTVYDRSMEDGKYLPSGTVVGIMWFPESAKWYVFTGPCPSDQLGTATGTAPGQCP